MFAEATSDAGRNTLPTNVAHVAGVHALEVLDERGVRDARTVAAELIGDGIATAECLVALQSRFNASVLGFRQDNALTGMLGAFPINRAGLKAVENGIFDAVQLDLDLVAQPGEEPAGYYGWGFAATSRDGARAVMRACVDIHRLLYFAVPTFARAVTADGSRALQSIGFRPHERHASLFIIAPSIGLVRG